MGIDYAACPHCGDEAVCWTSWPPDEDAVTRCAACGFPGQLTLDEEEGYWFRMSDEPAAVCDRADCEECAEFRPAFLAGFVTSVTAERRHLNALLESVQGLLNVAGAWSDSPDVPYVWADRLVLDLGEAQKVLREVQVKVLKPEKGRTR